MITLSVILIFAILVSACGGGQEPFNVQPANDLVPTTVVNPATVAKHD